MNYMNEVGMKVIQPNRFIVVSSNIENEAEVSKARHKYDVLHIVVNCLRSGKALLKRIKAFVSGTL